MTDSPNKEQQTASGAPSSAAAAESKAPAAKKLTADQNGNLIFRMRRRVVWASFWTFVGTITLMTLRFFFPRTLFEPSSVFTIGTPNDFGLGVDTRFQQQYRIWVVRKPDRLFIIYARCTHLGCTPDWKESENKFKCPCHGSGYDSDGINFEGPAPRPMDRAHVELNAQGQIVVDVSRLYLCERGKPCHFDDPEAFLVV